MIAWTPAEHRRQFANNVTLHGRYYPPPPAMLRLLREREAVHAPGLATRPDGRQAYESDPDFTNDCELKRAALVEDRSLGPSWHDRPGQRGRA
jgi:hypothetical protein